jgi:galactonate dehydratase
VVKITDVHTVLLTGPYSADPYILEARPRRSAAFIEVHTDTDLVGLGETYAGYFFPEAVPEVVAFYKPILVGKTVDRIAELWDHLYLCGNYWGRVGLGPAVLSGIDAALWDLKGKMLGLPVYELLGGRKHERLLCYASGGPSTYPKDRLAAKLDFYLGLGFRAVKLGAGSYSRETGSSLPDSATAAADFEADKLGFVRRHVGRSVKVALDGHMGNTEAHLQAWTLGTAQAVLKACEPFDLFFFEEPLPYTDPWGYAELCRGTHVPIAGGECLTAAYEWRVFAEQNAFDIGQPDGAFTGGLGEFLKVAAMLECRGRKVATHSAGAGGALMQNIHCAFACVNTAVCEILPALGPLHTEIAGDSFVFDGGMVLPPQKPGLGIVLTDAIKQRYPFVPGSGEFNSVPGKVLVD